MTRITDDIDTLVAILDEVDEILLGEYEVRVASAYDDEEQYGDIYIYPNYSGRGMYGSTVNGIVVSSEVSQLALGAAIGQAIDKLGLDFDLAHAMPTRRDSLGYDTILY